MKVVKEKATEIVTYSQRLRGDIATRLEEVAKASGIKRNPLVEAILEQVLSDPNFVLKIKK